MLAGGSARARKNGVRGAGAFGAPGNDRKLTDLHHTGSARTRGLCGRFRRREYTPFVLKFAARGRDSAEISRF